MIKKLGKYEIRKVLGKGATATVYLGHDPFAQRDVAIKVASPEVLKDPEHGKIYTHLFLNEASLVGKLNHPHIVQIYDAVVADKLCYIVMEYVPGGTLEAFTESHTLLPPQRVLEIIFKCTRALDFAFRLGITHRDIKPANILFANELDIKISDFGAAISHKNDTTQITGIGSPAYMSPQQVKEQPLDHRTDIYSLGVVMYQLLTGQLPFQASNNYNMVYQIINTEPTLPSALRPELPPQLDEIVSKAMAKTLEDRYQSWDEFGHALSNVVRERQLPASRNEFADTEKFATLRALTFFADFPDVELWEILRFSKWKRVPPGAAIVQDGEQGDFFCVVAEGELKVTKHGKMLNVLSAGDCFGEMAVISARNQTRGADVTALTDANIITVRSEALHHASEACRMHFYQAFLSVLADRLSMANQRLSGF